MGLRRLGGLANGRGSIKKRMGAWRAPMFESGPSKWACLLLPACESRC